MATRARRYPVWMMGITGIAAEPTTHLGERQEMTYPGIELSTNATKGEDVGVVEFVGHHARVESWKTQLIVMSRCSGKERIG